MRSDLIDLLLCVHVQTEKAVLVSDDGDRAKAVWLPFSQCEVEAKPGCGVGGAVMADVTLPERIAREKGLI